MTHFHAWKSVQKVWLQYQYKDWSEKKNFKKQFYETTMCPLCSLKMCIIAFLTEHMNKKKKV